MANQDRSAVEILRRRLYPTTGSGVIHIGDIVVADGSGNAKSAVDVTDGNATTLKDAVADGLLGVAIHAKVATETPNIAVGVDGVFEMSVAAVSGLATAAKVGDTVEIDTTGTYVGAPQHVVLGSTNPIGKVYEAAAIGSKTLLVHIVGIDVKAPVAAD